MIKGNRFLKLLNSGDILLNQKQAEIILQNIGADAKRWGSILLMITFLTIFDVFHYDQQIDAAEFLKMNDRFLYITSEFAASGTSSPMLWPSGRHFQWSTDCTRVLVHYCISACIFKTLLVLNFMLINCSLLRDRSNRSISQILGESYVSFLRTSAWNSRWRFYRILQGTRVSIFIFYLEKEYCTN